MQDTLRMDIWLRAPSPDLMLLEEWDKLSWRTQRLIMCGWVELLFVPIHTPDNRLILQGIREFVDRKQRLDELEQLIGDIRNPFTIRFCLLGLIRGTLGWTTISTMLCEQVGMEHRFEMGKKQAEVVRECVGLPWVDWDPVKSETALIMARDIYDKDDWRVAPVLADLLEDAGYPGRGLIAHLRQEGHIRGCWAIDHILGRS